jgi:folate-binding protein YgfZ
VVSTTLQVAQRPRAFVGVRGPEAAAFLERMVSNTVEELLPGGSCEALLLTPKARVVAPMTVVRRSADDFLLLTEPALGETLRDGLLRARFAAKCTIELEEHTSILVLGQGEGGVANHDYGIPAVELLDAAAPPGARDVPQDELERLRILARTPRFGAELDERVLPAEAGLDERAISFTKGCYPGQEPVARLHYRGRANRSLRVLALDGDGLPPYDAEVTLDGKPVGRITSVAPDPDHGAVGLAYVRREVSENDVLAWDGGTARQIGPDASGPYEPT